jgi:hypothetical protein
MTDEQLDGLIKLWKEDVRLSSRELMVPLKLPKNSHRGVQGHLSYLGEGSVRPPLSLQRTPFQIQIRESILYAWSAVGCLAIPALLEEKIKVGTICPATGTPIELHLAPGGVDSILPDECVLSITSPSYGADRFLQHADSSTTLANRVMRFFCSRQAASLWLIPYPGVEVLNIFEALRLAEAAFVVSYD